MEEIPPIGVGNFAGKDFFIRRSEPEEERFLPCRPFPKLKKHFLIIEHRLKSKLAWPVYIRSMKLKKNGAGEITTAKFEVFIGLEHEKCYLVRGINLRWGEG